MSAWIGPVEVDLIDPQLSESNGSFSIDMSVEWWQAHQLRELTNNLRREVTIGGSTGILEPAYFDDDLLGPLTSWALLGACELKAGVWDSADGSTGLVPVTQELVRVGDGTHRQIELSRSARAKAAGFDVTPWATVVNPFWDEDPAGSSFVVNPGGSRFTREYDASFPHSTPRLDGDARRVTIYTAPFAGDEDPFALVALPPLTQSFSGPPRWITDRGGDCRGYDRRRRYELYGPQHRIVEPSDLIITNGLTRGTVGSRGLVPHLRLEAFIDGRWEEEGYLYLADPESTSAVLRSCRLVSVTPELVTVALGVQGHGETFISLRRSARRFDAQNALRLQWHGFPPFSWPIAATSTDGKFGSALAPTADVILRWPPTATEAAWSVCGWVKAVVDSDTPEPAGLLSLVAADATLAGQVTFDEGTFRLELGADSVESGPETFSADDLIFVGLRHSATEGLALSIGNGGLSHAKDPSAVDPGSDGPFQRLLFAVSNMAAGDGDAGDGVAGGLVALFGAVDNLMIFDSYVSDDRLEALAAAEDRLDGLDEDEGSMTWFFPADAGLLPLASAVMDGRIYEATTAGGATRNPDDHGLTKVVAAIAPGALDVGLGLTGVDVEISAYLATTDDLDDLADHQNQFAAVSTQKVWVS